MKGEVIDWVKVPEITARQNYKLQMVISLSLKLPG